MKEELIDLEAEQAVISCLLSDVTLLSEIEQFLFSKHFYDETNRQVFIELVELKNSGKKIDLVVLRNSLQNKYKGKKWGSFLMKYIENTTIEENVYSYARTIVEKYNQRITAEYADRIKELATNHSDTPTLLSEVTKISDELQSVADNRPTSIYQDLDTTDAFITSSEDGLSSGVRAIDDVVGKLKKGNLVIVAARPGTGKTTIAIQYILNACKEKKKCLFFSYEMTKQELVCKVLSHELRIDSEHFDQNNLTPEEYARFGDRHEKVLKGLKDYFFLGNTKDAFIESLATQSRQVNMQGGVDFIIVDYIGLVSTRKKIDNYSRELGEVARTLKLLAKELNIPILALAQISRESDKTDSKLPSIAMIKYSGDLEANADRVVMLHYPYLFTKDSSDLNKMIILGGKRRLGKIDNREVFCDLRYGLIKDNENQNFYR